MSPDAPRTGAGDDASGDVPSPEERLEYIRTRILELDEGLVRLAGERLELVLEVGRLKAAMGRPVMDPAREAAVVRRAAEKAREEGVDAELVRDLIWRIIDAAREVQEARSSWGPPSTDRPRDDDGVSASE